MERIADREIAWLEEPVPTEDLAGSTALAAELSTPIAGYETETGLPGFRNTIAQSSEAVELVTAESGEECAALLQQGGFDLAFIDVNMPGMSGMEALGAARHNGDRTFVALMSSRTKRAIQFAQLQTVAS